ncbi:hypothetical protein MKK69_14825 [Methylobacterium sp. J-026]|uniref:tyrosine-protein kinase family protein n=1 Tax=Methylobacterium sp. J-026 TaxID=2836624 RepID=UPI001FB93123|nr:hypothetical protein [Methylobacterium sp. J-026]MCJ2135311.1 hypothetical protein [Methylobacterium sp. J-026]
MIVTVHSPRGGVGTTTLAGHLAVQAARGGRRVGVADCCLRAPDLHALFGVAATACLNDFLWHRCGIAEAALDLGGDLPGPLPAGAGLYLLPASPAPGEIARLLNDGLDPGRLARGLRQAMEVLALDLLILDAPAGFGDDAVLAAALADCLLVLLPTEPQRHAGLDLTLLERLEPARMLIVGNQAAPGLDVQACADAMAASCRRPVAAILPRCDGIGPPGRSPRPGQSPAWTAFAAGLHRIADLITEGRPSAGSHGKRMPA